MVLLSLACAFSIVMWWLAARANTRFSGVQRLPLQWLGNGVTRDAPRRAALAFVPALGTFVFASYAALALTVQPRPGQGYLVIPVMFVLGFVFLGVQGLHLYLVARTLRRDGR